MPGDHRDELHSQISAVFGDQVWFDPGGVERHRDGLGVGRTRGVPTEPVTCTTESELGDGELREPGVHPPPGRGELPRQQVTDPLLRLRQIHLPVSSCSFSSLSSLDGGQQDAGRHPVHRHLDLVQRRHRRSQPDVAVVRVVL